MLITRCRRQCRGDRRDLLGVPTKRLRGDRGRVFLSKAFLTDAAWRGAAASLRIPTTICASSECLRGCVGMSPGHYGEKTGRGLVTFAHC